MKRYVMIVLAFSILAAMAVAQDKPQDKIEISTNPPPPAMSLPIIKQVGKAQAMYNERTDKAIAQTVPLRAAGDGRNGISLRAEFEVVGKKIQKPTTVKLTLYSTAADRAYADNRAVNILLDGQSALSDTAQFESGNTNGQVFLISVVQQISYDLFLKMLSAQKVEIKIGPTAFNLTENHLEALRDLKKLAEQPE